MVLLFLRMSIEEFKTSLSNSLPGNISVYLESLWYDGTGNWEKSHSTIQDIEDKNAAWIHAYLHRKEGDIWNADYWYKRAGKKRPAFSLEEEWEELVKAFL
ncbi:MAG: hypothetical protein JWM28_1568 [Chitinophagaceae bacterium]|nr:hypothetical protein [Chitinophagaceae bacterium]